MKAVLYLNRVEAKGHSVLELLENLEEVSDLELKEFYASARLLDKHYAPPRYPNLHPGIPLPSYKLYSEEDAERCIESARKIVEFMKKLLES